MSPINPKAAYGVWCALLLCASMVDAVPNSSDRLQADMAARNREIEESDDRPDPHRSMYPEFDEISLRPSLLENLSAEDLAKMSLDTPLLKWAYAKVFLDSMGPFKQLEPQQELVLADMRRRGEAVSPMLLKLIEENRETRIESSVLAKIDHLGTVRLEPFLEYARKLLRERTRSDVLPVASGLLARRGTKEDIELFEWVLTQRPFAVTSLTQDLKRLRARMDIPASAPRNDTRPDEPAQNHQQDGSVGASHTKPWLIGGVILVVLLGLYRLLRKGLRRPQS